MNNILYIKSSVLGDNSQSGALLNAIFEKLHARHPDAQHVLKDLAVTPLPHLRPEHLKQAPAEGVKALAELKVADLLVIGAPMYNFGIPSTLKAWLDHVLKAGETFQYTAEGPRGLLSGKKAILVVTHGGVYSEGPYAAADFVVPYLKTALGFIGITDVEVIRAEGLAMGPAGEASLAKAREQIAAL